MAEQEFSMPCLGRYMELGTLYDYRTEKVISGNLWDSEKIKQNYKPHPNAISDFMFITEDGSSTNTDAVDVDSNLKLSLYSGLVDVQGAAKYVKNFRSTVNEARVVLKYSCRSGLEKLVNFAQLAPENKSVLEEKRATHVVTEVEYGGDAFFIFSRKISTSENRHDLEFTLKSAIGEYVPIIDKGGATIRATVNKKENHEVTSLSCTFYGDVTLPVTLTFEAALDACQKLPVMIREEKRADNPLLYGKPKMVTLYPLCLLYPEAARVVRVIKSDTMGVLERFIEEIHCRLAEASQLQATTTCATFSVINEKVKNFRSQVQQLKLRFEDKIGKLVPEIRKGTQEERSLLEVLEKVKRSPFNLEKLKEWLNVKKREFNCLENYMNTFKDNNVEMAFETTELEKFTHNSTFRNVLVLSLGYIISDEDKYLMAMEQFSLDSNTDNMEILALDLEKKIWLDDETITSQLIKQMELFCSFAEANKNVKDLKYVAIVRSGEAAGDVVTPGTIHLYSKGTRRLFQVPSPSGIPNVVVPKGSIYNHLISWAPPETGQENVIRYKIYYRSAKRSKSRDLLLWFVRPFEMAYDEVATFATQGNTFLTIDETWRNVQTKGTETEFDHYSMMSTGYEYHFEIAAVTEAGETAHSNRAVFYI